MSQWFTEHPADLVGDDLSMTARGPRTPLYTREFAADPHRTYRQLREQFGGLAPVELAPDVPATLVLGYATAVRILNDPERFPADPRMWQQSLPEDSPVRPMMAWQPAARYNTGTAHARYRQASAAGIDGVDGLALHRTVETLAVPLINSFCTTGSADLLADYAYPLVFDVLNELLGCPADLGQLVTAGMAARFDTVHADEGMALLTEALAELIRRKRQYPGDDITSRLVQHPAGLDDQEMLAQLMSFYAAGIEPQRNLITNALLLMLTDDRFGGSVLGGSLSTRDALDEVLFNDPPMANFCTTYPRQSLLYEGVWLPAHQPVIISLAACNTDPAITGGDRSGNRSHLAWSTGPHTCPAKTIAYQIVQDAIDQLLDALPDLQLACHPHQLTWRPGPFHRALTALPVTFPPAPLIALPSTTDAPVIGPITG